MLAGYLCEHDEHTLGAQVPDVGVPVQSLGLQRREAAVLVASEAGDEASNLLQIRTVSRGRGL